MESELHIDSLTSGEGIRLQIRGEMNVYAAAELQRSLQGALRAHHEIELDLAGVTELDTAGLQQLYLLERQAQRANIRVCLLALSTAARELFELYGMQVFFGHVAAGALVAPASGPASTGSLRADAPRVSNFEAVLPTFLAEASELADGLEAALLELARTPHNLELIHSAFRAVHTIKGAAGLFDFDAVVHFTHGMESLLARLRGDALGMDTALANLLLRCCDHVRQLVHSAADATPLAPGGTARGLELEEQLRRRGPAGWLSAAPRPAGAARSAEYAGEAPAGAPREDWQICVQFGSNVLRRGMDPASILKYLKRVGEITQIVTSLEAVPGPDAMDAEACYLSVELVLRTAASEAGIEAAFEFVRDDCQLRILPALGRRAAAEQGPSATLAATGALLQQPSPTEAREPFVRVHADKLDQLIDLVGELMVSSAAARLVAERLGKVELLEASSDVARLVEEVRNHALGLRMVPIGATFQRFARVIHDVSAELGKSIDLVVVGGESELDKSVVEQLNDPLLHLVRNAIAHGIEPTAERIAQGKGERGRIVLNARHDSGSIVVEVRDDGAGLKRARILQEAVARGLVANDCELSDAEVYALIFHAGFSTAEQVSDLAGRGVGMDVVKRRIESLRGSLELDSAEGGGTTVRIRLPLTLAIIDGFLLALGSARYVIPLDTVRECLEFGAPERASAEQRGFLLVRGRVLPIVHLREHLQIKAPRPERQNVIVVRSGGKETGLVVDELLGEIQTVIKPIGTLFRRVRGISGSALLGSGQVALILDVNGLLPASSPTAVRVLSEEATARSPRALASGA